MTCIDVENIIITIAKDFDNLKLYIIKKGDKEDLINPGSYYRGSWCAGHITNEPEIWIGYGYYKPEHKLIAFFHELGHITSNDDLEYTKLVLNQKTSKLKIDFERDAWKNGLIIAKKYNYDFDISILRWAINCLWSYKNYK